MTGPGPGRRNSPPVSPYTPVEFIRELLRRNGVLGAYALLCLAGALASSVGLVTDDRVIEGVSVWLKPTKFFLSVAVFSGTAAWFFGYVRPERRQCRLLRLTVAVLLITASYELFWITWQGALGLRSHFNFDTPLYSMMYALMGVGAYASSIPLFAWNQAGGDLRVAHFLGIHAEQAIPLMAIAFAKAGWRGRLPVVVAAFFWAALTIGLWISAMGGQPLIAIQGFGASSAQPPSWAA